MKRLFTSLSFIFCLFLFSQYSFGQEIDGNAVISPSNESGEIASSVIDVIRNQMEKSKERLFVIVKLGDNENSLNIVANRLKNTRQFLFINKDIDRKRIVFAQGERVKGEGKIEFYLGSELRLVLLAKRNKMPNLTCCPV